MIARHSFARVGLLGNPSDGYGGKTLSLTIGQYRATVELQANRCLTIHPGHEDGDQFESLDQFAELIDRRGLYGGVRLLKATLKRFHDYCQDRYPLNRASFSISYRTDIPRGVGLAGSSAIVTAALKALVAYFELDIPPATLASLALSVERDVLGIPAGLQDRVIQMLQGVVYMDFSADAMSGPPGLETGRYESLPGQPPGPLYVAFDCRASQPTEVYHSNLRERFLAGDRQVVAAMRQFAEFASLGRAAWLAGHPSELSRLIDANFDLRSRICRLPETQLQMIRTARAAGASAKFCGSGGAITGMLADAEQFPNLARRLAEIGCQVLQPQIV